MKRYALFLFNNFYPAGGWDDLKGTYDTVEEAKAYPTYHCFDNQQIIDLQTGEEVR
jgi:hypothetical protein